MRILHTADWHLGRVVLQESLLDDQAHLLEQVMRGVKDTKADALIIAGDIFDRQNPKREAVALFDDFLTQVYRDTDAAIIGISGNHDAPERVAFGRGLQDSKRVLIRGPLEFASTPLTLEDKHGKVAFSALPFGEVYRLAEIEQRLVVSLPIQDEALQLKRVANNASDTFDAACKSEAAAELALEISRQSAAAAHQRQTRMAQLTGLVSDAIRRTEDAKSYARADTDLVEKRTEFTRASESLTAEKEALSVAEQVLLHAEAALSRVQAVHLAGKLVDGEPCSVCGALHHPSPAIGSAESEGLNKAFEDARAAKQLAEQKERQAQSRYERAKALLDAAQATFSSRSKPEKTAVEAEAMWATAQSELSGLRALPSVETAIKAAADANQNWTDARQSLEKARLAKDDAASAALTCAQKLESAFDGIHPSLRDQQAVAAALKSARTKSNTERERHAAVITTEREAQRALDIAEAKLQEHIRTHETIAKTEKEARIEFTAAIEALGWSSNDYMRAKADVAQQETLTQRVQDFLARFKSCQDRLERANAAVEGLIQPDLPVLTLAAHDAAAVARSAQDKHSSVVAKLFQQEATHNRCNQIKQAKEESERRFGVVGGLKAVANGENEFRLSLVDFAIAATFEDVLDAANTRFRRMSRGRFSLHRRTEMKDGRSRAGLDIDVHDNFTDRTRDAHTLSGGESFMAALSLALGLSDVVQQRAGGIKLDVIFIDEGFGSLDDQTLDNVLSTLRDLVGNNRAVGVISHIEMVKQQIQAGFEVSRSARGSRVTQRTIQ